MSVAIFLLNWRGADDTIAAIESLLKSTYGDFQILVCDNASNDGSMEKFLAWAARNPGVAAQGAIKSSSSEEQIQSQLQNKIVWVETGANLGFAGGNNVGIRLAMQYGDFKYFWLLNNDCEVHAGALDALVVRMEAESDIGICGAFIHYFDPAHVQACAGAVYNPWTGRARYVGHQAPRGVSLDRAEVESRIDYVCGASMFVRREYIERIGLMAEDYFLYFEELDWAERGRSQFRLGYAPDAIVFHKEGASIGSNSDTRKTSHLADFYLFRNRLRFTWRHHPLAFPVVWLTLLLTAVSRVFRGQVERAWLILKVLFGVRVYRCEDAALKA